MSAHAPTSAPARLRAAVATLAPEQRLAAVAAIGLGVSMFLPWYVNAIVLTRSNTIVRERLTAFGSFSFVEAAVLLVALGVLWMLFARAERRAFHLPGGDGFVILLAGLWTGALIFYRMLDTPSASVKSSRVVSVGLQWGIFIALAAAGVLAYAGTRLRAAHRPEPELADDPTIAHAVIERPLRAPLPPRGKPRSTRRTAADQAETEQLSFEDEAGRRDPFS